MQVIQLKKTDLNARITEIENEVPSICSLATTSALTAVENEIPNVSSLVKKKQIMTQKLVKLKRNLLTLIMTSILLLQNLMIYQQGCLLQD